MPPTDKLTRERVLEVAAQLFAERGYSHTRLKDIAASFGVTHAALYYHFERKEDILIELNKAAIEGLLLMAHTIHESETIPADEQFDHVIYGHAKYVAQNVERVASLFEGEYALPDDFALWLRNRRREYTEIVTDMFRAGQKAGRLTDDNANLVVSIIIGAATWAYRWYRPTGDWTPEQLAEETTEIVSRGYLRDGIEVALPNAVGDSVKYERTRVKRRAASDAF